MKPRLEDWDYEPMFSIMRHKETGAKFWIKSDIEVELIDPAPAIESRIKDTEKTLASLAQEALDVHSEGWMRLTIRAYSSQRRQQELKKGPVVQ